MTIDIYVCVHLVYCLIIHIKYYKQRKLNTIVFNFYIYIIFHDNIYNNTNKNKSIIKYYNE